jgi:phytoene synthase
VSDDVTAIVRAGDRDRYLASLFAPDDRRPHLHALYAFNIELARIRDQVSEPAIGEIRLQWWIDALPSIHAGAPPGHPVAVALAGAIKQGGLPLRALLNMAEARRFDLYDDPVPTLADLEGYLGETSSALIQLGAMSLAGDDAQASAAAAGFAGVAMGISGVLRSLLYHRARGQCFVPRDVLERHGASPSDFLSGREHAGVKAAIAELVAHGRKRLAEARAATIDSRTLPAFLPAGLAELYFDRLESREKSVLNEAIEVSQLRRQYALWRSARRHRF